jgi:hypothetical protein
MPRRPPMALAGPPMALSAPSRWHASVKAWLDARLSDERGYRRLDRDLDEVLAQGAESLIAKGRPGRSRCPDGASALAPSTFQQAAASKDGRHGGRRWLVFDHDASGDRVRQDRANSGDLPQPCLDLPGAAFSAFQGRNTDAESSRNVVR